MMRFALFVFAFVAGFTVAAQSGAFERYYDSGTSDVVRGMALLPDRVVLVGYTEPTDRSSRRSSMIVTDREGKLVSSSTWPSPRRSYFLDVTAAGTDEVLVGGWQNDSITLDNWMFYRMSTSGVQRAGFGWGDFLEDEEIFGLVTRPDGTFVAVGSESTSNAALIGRFTAEGRELWRRKFIVPGSRFTSLQRVINVPGGILAVGWTTVRERTYSTILVKYDNDGAVIWQRKFDWPGQTSGNFRHVIHLPSGRLILAAPIRVSATDTDIVLLQLDGEGNLVRSGTMGSSGQETIGALHPAPTGQEGFFLVGRHRPAGRDRTSALFVGLENILDPNLSAGLFAPDQDSYFFDATVDEAGNYYLAGTLRECPDGDRDAYLVKTNFELETPATICYQTELMLDGEPLTTVVQSSVGEAEVSVAPEVTPAVAEALACRASRRSCPAYDLDADDSSGAAQPGNPFTFNDYQRLGICYTEPIPVTDVDVASVRSNTYTDSIVLSVAGSPPRTEYLRLDSIRSDLFRTLTLRNDGTMTDADFIRLLRRVRYHVEQDTIAYGTRSILLLSYTGCRRASSTPTITLELLPNTIDPPALPDTTVCPDGILLVDATTAGVTNYAWGDGAQDAIREIREPGRYTLQRANACASRIDTFDVALATTTPIPLLPSLPLCTGDSALVDLTAAGLTYAWADGDTSAVRYFYAPTETTVTLSDGCTEVTRPVVVVGQDCCPLYFPSAFSPNADGVNDRFRAFPALDCRAEISEVSFRIYDRWGGLVFSGDTLTDGWDGTSRGQAAATGTYVYFLSYFDGFARRERRGAFVIVR